MPPIKNDASTRTLLLACLLLAVAGLAAYANTFHVPFFFDDKLAIAENDSIRHLDWQALNPPNTEVAGVIGRPLVNFSLAINYALSGYEVESYHVLNLFIHILATWLLFDGLRHLLRRAPLAEYFGEAAVPLAFTCALIWSVHPLLTETVTCVAQRNESMMAVFYLLTLDCFLRSVEAKQNRWWQLTAVAACFLGMATKEVMVSAPLMVLLFDRTFVAGSFRQAWRERKLFYIGLALSWALLGYLMGGSGQRDGTVGFGLGMSAWSYALKQCEAIIHYLRLAFLPYPLVLDYGTDVVDSLAAVWPQAVLLVAILAGTAYALVRKPVAGLAGAWMFLILAPSSSFVPLTTQTEAEHRMYLPLAAITTLMVLLSYRRFARRSYVGWGVVAILFAAGTWARNHQYRTEVNMWQVTTLERPKNDSAHFNLACALLTAKDYRTAAGEFAVALQLNPANEEARVYLGVSLMMMGQTDEAIQQLDLAAKTLPEHFGAVYNLGCALLDVGQLPPALTCFQKALQLKPDSAPAENNLGSTLTRMNKPAEALPHFEAALNTNPDSPETHANYGEALLLLGQTKDATAQLEKAVQLQPTLAMAQQRLGVALLAEKENAEAYAHANEAIRLAPDNAEAHFTLGNILNVMHEPTAAITEYSKALLLQPGHAQAANNLGYTLQELGRKEEALAAYNHALEVQPNYAEARRNRDDLLKTMNAPPSPPAKATAPNSSDAGKG